MKEKEKARKSVRLKDYDYSTPWWYYVTICTYSHRNYFGKVINGKMILSEIGNVAKACWEDIPKHHNIVELDYYVIMPNHIHGIIIINEHDRDVQLNIPTSNYFSKISPKKNSLSVIIRTYKAAVSTRLKKLNINFRWQSSYYDRIVRNERELFEIRKYIEQNPLKWEIEKNIPANLNL